MIAILTLIYCGLIWLLFFKLKLVEPNVRSYTAAAIVGVVVIGAILLAMNLFQPYSTNAVISQYVVQIAPQVTGQVTTVPASPNQPIKKGDILFTIDPAPFQATVDGLKAALVQSEQSAKMLKDSLDSAKASVVNAQAALVNARQQVKSLDAQLDAAIAAVDQVIAQRDLAKSEYERVAAAKLQDPGAVSDAVVDAKRQSLLSLEESLLQAIAAQVNAQAAVDAVLDGKNTVVRQAEAQLVNARAMESQAQLAFDSVIDGENTAVAQVRAQLDQAEINLAFTTVAAPANGFVTNLQLREGSAAQAGQPVMTFVDTSERYLIAPLGQNVVRHVEVGNDVEVALELYPGRILNGTVESIIWASGEGQGNPSGSLPDVASLQGGTSLAVRISFPDLPATLELPVGAGGRAAVYTAKGKPFRIIRKVIIRMYTWLNYI
ncbi:MAG: HlyD family secretion protein [Acidobacteriota bacterium]|jgi:multidrug resistance efflux pump|nr:HlyD family secretion protein [Acidobacteriota bacterium]